MQVLFDIVTKDLTMVTLRSFRVIHNKYTTDLLSKS